MLKKPIVDGACIGGSHEKEKSNIQNLSVCYCLMKRESSNQTGTVRMSPMTEMLNHVQLFMKNKGAAVYSQAFVYRQSKCFCQSFLSSILLAFVPVG